MKYVHKVRSFDGITFNDANNALTLDLNYISIMRTRTDAKEPCDADLHNDDKEWMQEVVKMVGCVPQYWKILYSVDQSNNLNECNETSQLKKVSKYLPFKNELMTNAIFRKYHPPCHRMRALANTNSDRNWNPDILKVKIKFRYFKHDFVSFKVLPTSPINTHFVFPNYYLQIFLQLRLLRRDHQCTEFWI